MIGIQRGNCSFEVLVISHLATSKQFRSLCSSHVGSAKADTAIPAAFVLQPFPGNIFRARSRRDSSAKPAAVRSRHKIVPAPHVLILPVSTQNVYEVLTL